MLPNSIKTLSERLKKDNLFKPHELQKMLKSGAVRIICNRDKDSEKKYNFHVVFEPSTELRYNPALDELLIAHSRAEYDGTYFIVGRLGDFPGTMIPFTEELTEASELRLKFVLLWDEGSPREGKKSFDALNEALLAEILKKDGKLFDKTIRPLFVEVITHFLYNVPLRAERITEYFSKIDIAQVDPINHLINKGDVFEAVQNHFLPLDLLPARIIHFYAEEMVAKAIYHHGQSDVAFRRYLSEAISTLYLLQASRQQVEKLIAGIKDFHNQCADSESSHPHLLKELEPLILPLEGLKVKLGLSRTERFKLFQVGDYREWILKNI